MNIDYRGRRATIMGLGHFGGGVAAARWLARQGALVTVSDSADEAALADALPALSDVPIAAMHLGGHREEDFLGAELIVVNPAVRPTSPWLAVARRSAARVCTEIELLIENCPATIVGVTGSNGKSTTAAMIAAILKAAGRRTFLGGNIGGSLLEQLPQIVESSRHTPCACHAFPPPGDPRHRPVVAIDSTPADGTRSVPATFGPPPRERLSHIERGDWVVLEISSFQLWHAGQAATMPHVAVVTGCSPNHLDWHESYADYVAAKQRIFTGQTPDDLAVLNTFDREVAAWAPLLRGRQVALPDLKTLPPLRVPGEHNRMNAACAAAAAIAAGCTPADVRRGLEHFSGLPQRLEWFAVIEGRRFYNDSTATTPESTIAALRTLEAPIWLLAGGKNKGADLGPLAAEIVRRACGAALFGTVREELFSHVKECDPQFAAVTVENMEQALGWCWPRSRPGDVLLLSPGCASTDQFCNFRQRGEHFAELVRELSNPLNRQSPPD